MARCRAGSSPLVASRIQNRRGRIVVVDRNFKPIETVLAKAQGSKN
jgi:hypothetical protein